MSFVNKVVLVTGSGSGIGEAAVILFAREGADVVIVDINEGTANKTAEKCEKFGGKVIKIKADVSKNEDAQITIDKTIANLGKIDVLVNNAGTSGHGTLLAGDIMDTYDKFMNNNLRSVVLMTSLATPYLIKTKGCIVNTSSTITTVLRVGRNHPAYCMSKVGIDCFTRLSAIELSSSGVRVNAVNPGPVYTNIYSNSKISGAHEDLVAATILKKVSDPSEIAELILYLSSDKAKSITGSTYVIDNGMNLV